MVSFPADPSIRPLPIWAPEATAGDLAKVKAAYLALGIPGKVRPVEALPGSPGPILAIGSKPDFVCDYAPVSSFDSPGLSYALRCILTDTWDERMISDTEALSDMFGAPVEFLGTMVQVGGEWTWEEEE